MESGNDATVSHIRRKPSSRDRELARAMEALHEVGPRIVVELQNEVRRLRQQVERLESASERARQNRSSGRSSELVGLLRSG